MSCYNDYQESYYDTVLDFCDELKDSLLPSVKQELEEKAEKVEKLRSENDKLDRRISELKWDLEVAKESENVILKRLNSTQPYIKTLLTASHKAYSIRTKSVFSNPKCDFCNDKRQVVATAPNGQKETIECSCAKEKHTEYELVEKDVIETGLKDYPLLYIKDVMYQEVELISADKIDKPKPENSSDKWNSYYLFFTTEETAATFASACGWKINKKN